MAGDQDGACCPLASRSAAAPWDAAEADCRRNRNVLRNTRVTDCVGTPASPIAGEPVTTSWARSSGRGASLQREKTPER